MKLIITLVISFIGLLNSTFTLAECTNNRNLGIIISKPDNLYIDHGDGTVTDKKNGLMWQKCSLGLSGNDCVTGTAQRFNWKDAFAAANGNTDNGYTDWRLPNKNEIASLIDGACASPAINSTVFPATIFTQNVYYWSSTPYSAVNSWSWAVSFYAGRVNAIVKQQSFYVRLVRGEI